MPPSNAGYYHAAYIATAVIYVVYALSIYWRASRVRRELGTLDSRDQQQSAE